MNETVESTATVVDETPVEKKSLFSKKNIIIAATSVAATAAACYAIVKFNSDDEPASDEETVYDPSVVETLSDLTNPDQK